MHVQPGSRERRGPLTVEEHARLRARARAGSLVTRAAHRLGEEALTARIEQLAALEELGYVHVGERSWLEEVRSVPMADRAWWIGGTPPVRGDLGYADWVRRALDALGLTWEVDRDDPSGEGASAVSQVVWRAELDGGALGLGFPHLGHPAIWGPPDEHGVPGLDDDLGVRVAGDAHGPWPSHLVTAFEALHDLEYALPRQTWGEEAAPLQVVGVEASNVVDPRRWYLCLVSDDGATLAGAVDPD